MASVGDKGGHISPSTGGGGWVAGGGDVFEGDGWAEADVFDGGFHGNDGLAAAMFLPAVTVDHAALNLNIPAADNDEHGQVVEQMLLDNPDYLVRFALWLYEMEQRGTIGTIQTNFGIQTGEEKVLWEVRVSPFSIPSSLKEDSQMNPFAIGYDSSPFVNLGSVLGGLALGALGLALLLRRR